MKIGAAWTETTEAGKTYITVALDDILGVLFPFLKPLINGCFITLWHIPQEERNKPNSPGWSVTISKKDEKKTTNEEPQAEDLT